MKVKTIYLNTPLGRVNVPIDNKELSETEIKEVYKSWATVLNTYEYISFKNNQKYHVLPKEVLRNSIVTLEFEKEPDNKEKLNEELQEWLRVNLRNREYGGGWYWYVAGTCPYSNNTLWDNKTFKDSQEAIQDAIKYYNKWKEENGENNLHDSSRTGG